jgi:hypothetical protein
VNPDWNMVGSVSSPVDVSTITSVPPGMVTSNFFKFVPGAGFTASTTVDPGLAYWVKVTGAGKLILNASGGAPAAGQIRVIPTDEIPPPPPADGPDAKLPSAYALGQNYPNPFNPGTTIRFDLPEAAVVNLVVYDILGRTVALLVDGTMEAGSHDVRFDAPALPGGVYFYRLRAGTFSETRKFTLLK